MTESDPCPLWVIRDRVTRSAAHPLYPQLRKWARLLEIDENGQRPTSRMINAGQSASAIFNRLPRQALCGLAHAVAEELSDWAESSVLERDKRERSRGR